MRRYNSSLPRDGYGNLVGLIDTFKFNSSDFPAEIRTTSSHIPSQFSSKHPWKGYTPQMVKWSNSSVTWLAVGIVLRTRLISRKTTSFRASLLIMAWSAKTWRHGRCLRFTKRAGLSRPCWETCQIRVISIIRMTSYRRYPMSFVDLWDIILPVCCKRHRG